MSQKGQEKDKKGREKDKKGQIKDKGFCFYWLVSKRTERTIKDKKHQGSPPWVFIPVRNILVFFYFYKVNEKIKYLTLRKRLFEFGSGKDEKGRIFLTETPHVISICPFKDINKI